MVQISKGKKLCNKSRGHLQNKIKLKKKAEEATQLHDKQAISPIKFLLSRE